jgi:glycosyltransferase involved in cell wall biosynthesis
VFKIAILHYSCPPVVGGVEEIVRQQASLFDRYHHSVEVYSGSGSQFTQNYAVELNLVLSSRHPEILKLQKDATKNFAQIETISEQIHDYFVNRLSKDTILIAHNVLTMPFNLPLTLALHKIADQQILKVISWNHDSPYFYDPCAPELDREPWLILKKFNKNIHYVTISESRNREFKSLYDINDELLVIPNGVDPISFFRLNEATVRLILENCLFDTELILFQPSRLHPRKNIELSIRVVKELNELGIKVKLLLTGAFDPHHGKDFRYYNHLKNLIESLKITENIIIFAEHTFDSGEKMIPDHVIIRDLYHISDLLFLPSLQEGFGIPILEAGMIRLPIACSDIEPFKTIAGENVFYYTLNEKPREIAKGILKFLGGLKTYDMYRSVIRNYVWDNIYHRSLLPFLQKIVSSP